MNKQAHKCECCKKSISGQVNKKYCSNGCRQAAYRKRKASPKRMAAAKQRALSTATCDHCGGSFLAASSRAKFCSTSCRSLYHRALKAAIPAALIAAYQLPQTIALDLIDCQPMHKLRGLLTERGFTYQHDQRQWVQP